MNWSLFEQIKKYLTRKKRQKTWKKIVMSMAVAVVFVTTYMLVLPALTMTQTPVCGKEEHTHTEKCYKEEPAGEPTCGQEESEGGHQHSKECFPKTKKVLICGKEEHQHTKACYEKDVSTSEETTKEETTKQEETTKKTAQSTTTKTETRAVVQSSTAKSTKAANNEIDFTKYITSATVYKLVNGEWKPATEFTEGDQVRVKLEYKLPAGTITSDGGKTISYQLPDGVAPAKTETGKVYQGTTEVGTYEINSDGTVKITFNDEFSNGEAFLGDLQFEGTVSKTGTGDEDKIDFGGDAGSITVKKDTEHYDIKTKKEAQKISDNRIQYTISVSSEQGTKDNLVTIKDIFQENTATGIYDKSSFKIYKVDANGNQTEVTGKTPTFSEDENGNQNFTIKDLPALEAGEKYIVKYEADTKILSENGAGTVKNKAGSQTGKKEHWDWSTVEISKAMIYKQGWYDKEKGLILWRVTVNQSKKDIGGYTFTDELPQDLVGDVVIKDSSNKQIGTASVKDNKISYTFADGSKDTYTIEYWTKAPDQDGTVTNHATIKKGDDSYNSDAKPNVEHRDWNLSKSYKGTEIKNDQSYYRWSSVITLPDGKMGTFTYTDTIEPATSQAGTSTPGEDSHYALASELQEQLEQLKINLSINGEIKEVGYQNDYVTFEIKYYDKDGKEISASDQTSKVRKFEIKITPKKGYEDISGTQMSLNYSTITDISGMTEGDTWRFTNSAKIPGHTAKADHDYKKESPIEKQNGINHGSYMEYKDGTINVDYDKTNGILYYRLIIRTKATDDDEITITDTLPEGATLVENSVTGVFYGNSGYRPSGYGSYDFNGKQKITYTTDGQKVILKIAKGYNSCGKVTSDSLEGNTLEVMYQVSVKDDDFWKNPTNESKDYTNKAEWNGNSSEETTTVDKNVEKVQKSGEQLKDENGNWINAIQYKVVINPTGKDLLKDSDQLTLTDTMTIPDGVDAYLDLSQVKLYQLDASKEDQLGEEISSDRYQVMYDQKTHTMTLKLPDELACVLVYRYDIDSGNKKDPQLSNKVSLSGGYTSNTGTKIDTSSSSATVKRAKLTLYKVDGDNYKKLLPNAEFSLEYWDGENNKWVMQASSLKTGEDGTITLDVASADKEHELSAERLYRLTEIKAPEGYQMVNKQSYFIYKGYQSDGSVLSDTKVYENAKAKTSKVEQKDVNFYGSIGGILYIPNNYARVSVKKVWTDSSNKTADPITDSVKVQLYRQKTKLDGYTVTVKTTGIDGVIDSKTIIVAKNTSITLGTTGSWKWQDYKITVNGATEDLKTEMGNTSYTVDNISGDTEIVISSTHANQYDFGSLELRRYEEATQYTVAGSKEKIGEEVTLSNDNNWNYLWDELTKTDSDGNPYYYTVEEIDPPKGSTVSYTNNDGIKTGEITVINKIESYKLPETGGPGTTIYTKAGILLMTAGIILLYWKRKYQ